MKKMSLKDYSRFLINEDTSDSQSEDESQNGNEDKQAVKILYTSPSELDKAFKNQELEKARHKLTLAYLLAFDLLDRRCSGLEEDAHESLILNLKTGDSDSESEEDSGDNFIVGNSINLSRLKINVVKSKSLFVDYFNSKPVKINDASLAKLEVFRKDFDLILNHLIYSDVEKLILENKKAIKIKRSSYRKLLGQTLLTKQRLKDSNNIFDINEIIKQISDLNSIDNIVGLDQGSDQDSAESVDSPEDRIKEIKSLIEKPINDKENFLIYTEIDSKKLPVLICYKDTEDVYQKIVCSTTQGQYANTDLKSASIDRICQEVASYENYEIKSLKKIGLTGTDAKDIINTNLDKMSGTYEDRIISALAAVESDSKNRLQQLDQTDDQEYEEQPDADALAFFESAADFSKLSKDQIENINELGVLIQKLYKNERGMQVFFKYKKDLYQITEEKVLKVSISELNKINSDDNIAINKSFKFRDVGNIKLVNNLVKSFLEEEPESEGIQQGLNKDEQEDGVEPDVKALEFFKVSTDLATLDEDQKQNLENLSVVINVNNKEAKTGKFYIKYEKDLYQIIDDAVNKVSVSELNGSGGDNISLNANFIPKSKKLLDPIKKFLKEKSEAGDADEVPEASKEITKLDKIKPLLKEDDDLSESNYSDKIDYDKIKKAIMTNRDIAEQLLKQVFTKKVSKLSDKKRQRLFAGSFATLIKINLMAILQDAQGKQGLNEGNLFNSPGFRSAVGVIRKGMDTIGSGFGLGSTKIGMGILDNKLSKTAGSSASIYGAVGMIGKLFGASFASSAMFSLAPAALASYATYKFVTRCSKNIKREGGVFHKNPESFLKNIMEDDSFEAAVRHEVELFYENIDQVDLEKGSIDLGGGVIVSSDLLQKTNKQKEKFQEYNDNIQEEIKKDYKKTLDLIRSNNQNLEKVIGLRNLKTVLNEIYLSLAKDLSQREEGAKLEDIKKKQDSLNAHVIQAITKHRTITEGILEDRITQIIQDAAKKEQGFASADFSKGSKNYDEKSSKGLGILDTISGAKQAEQISELAEAVCTSISQEFTGLDFENFVKVYGHQGFKDLKLEWALQSGSLGLLYEFGNPNLINPNLITENKFKRFFGIASAGALSFTAMISFLTLFRMLKKSGNDLKGITDFNKVKDMASVATSDSPASALDAANLELDMLHKVIRLKNGAYKIFYYTNMDALKGKADALSSILVRCKKGVPVKSEFVAHRPENILDHTGSFMERGGIDTASLKSGVVELKAGGGAVDVTHDPETLNILSYAYENLQGTVADLPLSYFTDDLQKTADAYLSKKSAYMGSGGGTIPKADQAFMTPAEKGGSSVELKAILTQRLEDFKATSVWQKMPADQQDKVVKYCDSFIGLEGNKLDAVLNKPPTFMPPSGTPDSMEALKSKSELMLRTKVNGQTMPKGNTGLVIAKQDLSLTDVWLATAGLTNLFHNLATYYSRKKIEPKEVAAIFREAFDPVKIVIVGFVVSLLGGRLEGQPTENPPIGVSTDDESIGTESIVLVDREDNPQTEPQNIKDGFIHNMSLKDFLFENKVTFKKTRKW